MYGIGRKPRMALFVSKYDHCLYDILGRYSALPLEIPLIISNHGDLKRGTFSIPFHYVPFTKISKPKSKRNIGFTEDYNIDFYCFGTLHANYHTELIVQYKNQIINIHLPFFGVSWGKTVSFRF
jgi:formyltetrahydrofolate deformylase